MSSSRRNAVPAAILTAAALGAAALSFIPGFPSFVFLSLLPAVAVAMAFMTGTAAGVLVAIASSVVLVVAGPRLSAEASAQVPMLIAAAWSGIFLVDWHLRRDDARRRARKVANDALADESRAIRKETSFYEARAAGLVQRAELRRRLSGAALELGASLDPAVIETKLLDLASSMFPNSDVRLALADDALDAAPVFLRGQAILTGDESVSGRSLMAVPLRTGNAIVAALTVSSPIKVRVFSWEDLRLLDVLAGLASEALDNAQLINAIRQNALRDGLTGLLTHRAFQDRLESAVLEASRYHRPVSLIMADIDHFKSVNDTLGHQAGDAVLQGFAHVLDRNVRDVDVVARYGGEEFVILLYEMPYDDALQIAERIRHDLSEQPFDIGRHRTHKVTASFGVSTFPDDATSGQQLLRQADQRLYAAKNGGRNRVVGRS